MLIDLLIKIWPFEVYPSSPFCEVEVGQVFQSGPMLYRLLYRDPWKAKLVQWNWFTKMFWGGNIADRQN